MLKRSEEKVCVSPVPSLILDPGRKNLGLRPEWARVGFRSSIRGSEEVRFLSAGPSLMGLVSPRPFPSNVGQEKLFRLVLRRVKGIKLWPLVPEAVMAQVGWVTATHGTCSLHT